MRIFHHNNPTNSRFASSANLSNSVYESADKWACINLINKDLGQWELMLKQKDTSSSSELKYRWIQEYNPFTATWTQIQPGRVTNVPGYSGTQGGMWAMNSSDTYFVIANTSSSNWFGAIGGKTSYNNGIPGYPNTTCTTGYMDLYIRIDTNPNINAPGLYTNLSGIYDSSKGWVASGNDSSASYIEFDKSIMNTLMTAKTFSISFWFRVHNTNRHILFGNATTAVYPLNIEYGSSKIRYYFASSPDLNGSTSISINTWYHFVLSVTSTGFKGYVNGNTDANYTSAPTFTQYTGNLRIGSDWRVDSGNNIFMGADISNFMIFDTALTAAQAKELYGK